MKTKKKSLVNVENTIVRRSIFLLLLLLIPVLIPIQAILIAVMEGFPEMLYAFAQIGKQNELETFKEVWLGQTEYRRRLRGDIGK